VEFAAVTSPLLGLAAGLPKTPRESHTSRLALIHHQHSSVNRNQILSSRLSYNVVHLRSGMLNAGLIITLYICNAHLCIFTLFTCVIVCIESFQLFSAYNIVYLGVMQAQLRPASTP